MYIIHEHCSYNYYKYWILPPSTTASEGVNSVYGTSRIRTDTYPHYNNNLGVLQVGRTRRFGTLVFRRNDTYRPVWRQNPSDPPATARCRGSAPSEITTIHVYKNKLTVFGPYIPSVIIQNIRTDGRHTNNTCCIYIFRFIHAYTYRYCIRNGCWPYTGVVRANALKCFFFFFYRLPLHSLFCINTIL